MMNGGAERRVGLQLGVGQGLSYGSVVQQEWGRSHAKGAEEVGG